MKIDGREYCVYSVHRTQRAANFALERYYAEGLISWSERPFVQASRMTRSFNDRTTTTRWVVWFPCERVSNIPPA